MERCTIGENAVVRSAELVRLKYSVAAVSLPVKILRASSKLIFFTAAMKIALACGVACSAARFMPTSNSSTLSPIPSIRMPFPTVCSLGGNRILIASFFRKPSGFPVSATALPLLTCNASLSPAIILSLLSPAVLRWFRVSSAFLRMSLNCACARQERNRTAIRNVVFIVLP